MSKANPRFDDLASGIQALDQQHQQIFALLQKINSAVQHLDGEQAEQLVIELLDFTVTHNHLEDQVMAESGYPQAAEHQALHQKFLEAVDGYLQQIVAGENPFVLARRVSHEITRWVETHLMIEDMQHMRYLSEQTHDFGHERPPLMHLAR